MRDVDVVRLSADGRELSPLVTAAVARAPARSSTTADDPTAPQDWHDRPQRRILGIVGAPGAGKSTLAAAVAALLEDAVVVPMDGFHLADVELHRRGLLERKGAPETFDGWGYAALLRRVMEAVTPENRTRTRRLAAALDPTRAWRLGIPVLAVAAADDPRVTPHQMAALTGPILRGSGALVPGARHLVMADAGDAFNLLMAAFLARVEVDAGA